MGFFDSVKEAVANAADNANNAFTKEVEALLISGETIEKTIKLVSDYFVFTQRRVIFVDAKLFSSKRAIVSIPYSKITEVVMITGGAMNFSQEVAVRIGTTQHDVKLYDPRQTLELYKTLIGKIL